MNMEEQLMTVLQAYAKEEKRLHLPRFFKTGKGEYAEGDRFLGVVVPDIRAVAKRYGKASFEELKPAIVSKWHEVRLCVLLILVLKSRQGTEEEREDAYSFYLAHSAYVNNWDLVDLSAPTVVGEYLLGKSHEVLYRLAESASLWDNRIAIVSTYAFIQKHELDDTYALAAKLMPHPHDLIHKAVGWMLREAGKRDVQRLFSFVERYRREMPRTMLRYAIEKFDEGQRSYLMRR
ncbi:DNA alkylation repair protein [Phocaeicola abscessus]|uniref:DNA alkylation repair protein n=1 Tax=Phocaeicola abscessus TaxID=555313 RepID=UPI0012ED8081|nr:DNA alkylation repair protein [Phocaeicola abscessus]